MDGRVGRTDGRSVGDLVLFYLVWFGFARPGGWTDRGAGRTNGRSSLVWFGYFALVEFYISKNRGLGIV